MWPDNSLEPMPCASLREEDMVQRKRTHGLWLHFNAIPQTTVNHRVNPGLGIKIIWKAQRDRARFVEDL